MYMNRMNMTISESMICFFSLKVHIANSSVDFHMDAKPHGMCIILDTGLATFRFTTIFTIASILLLKKYINNINIDIRKMLY